MNSARLAAFSAIAIPVYAAQLPLAVYLPAIFAGHYGIPLSVLGALLLIEKIWGALADPIIGALSDRTHNRFGRRRSWIAAGSVVFGLSGILLFFPAGAVTPLYLGVVMFAFYLGWSMLQIPFFAWSGEIAGDYHERTRVAGYQSIAASAALLLTLVLPTIVDQLRPEDAALKLHALGALLLATLIPGSLLTLFSVPDPPRAVGTRPGASLLRTWQLVLGNSLLMRVLASDLAVTIGQSIRATLFVFFTSSYMGLPQWASGLYLFQFVFGMISAPIWMRLGRRLGKHRAAVAGELAQVLINLGLLLVVPSHLPLLLGLTLAQGLAQGSGNLMLRSMVADIADDHRLRTGEDRTALFFSVFSISMKAGMAAAVGIALPLVAHLGFKPTGTNTPEALHGVLLVFALGPAIAHALSASLVSGFPLDEAAHANIRRQLAQLPFNPGSARVAQSAEAFHGFTAIASDSNP
jgi:GPH family glycoside/pentoside/hexuronide:cation symporter